MDPDEPAAKIAASYRRFADIEAAGRSPIYEEIARQVATDAEMIAFLAALPPAKRQPNLFLGAVQFVNGQPARGWDWFRHAVADRRDDVVAVMRSRSTQTNVPARCSPALAALPQPLALLEVGASAGLCLYPDRYTYDYGTRIVAPATGIPGSPVISCRADPGTPLPDRPVEVVQRSTGRHPRDRHARSRPASAGSVPALPGRGTSRENRPARRMDAMARARPAAVLRLPARR